MTPPIVFLDTETTGVHPGRQVWEIGMIRRTEIADVETSLMLYVNLSDADPFGLKIGGFYDRHPTGRFLSGLDGFTSDRDLSTPQQAAQLVAKWTHGAHIVGAVPNFDTETLDPLLRKHGYLPAWHYHLIDVEAMAVGYLAGRGIAVTGNSQHASLPWKSDDLTAALGLDPVPENERHTALGDARWAMRIYDRITADRFRRAGDPS